MAKSIDLTGKKVGKLTVLFCVPKEQRPTQNHGNYWECECECGNHIMVPTTYLTGNSNYTQLSCGCERKKRAFNQSTDLQLSDDFYDLFKYDFERFMFLHKCLVRTSGNNSNYFKNNIDEYKETILYFWNNKQFNYLYDNWNK